MKIVNAFVVVVSLFLTACGSSTAVPSVVSPTPTREVAPTPTRVPLPDLSGLSIAELADTITTGTALDATLAAQEALARGGVTVTDLTTVYLQARTPAGSMIASPEETLYLALEARQKATGGTLTAAELGQMLSDFGWPFPADRSPGETMIQFFGAWVTEGQNAPDDPHNFAPLFLAELASRQSPPVDLAAGDAPPEQVRFTLLELELFAAAFDRGVVVAGAAKPRGLARPVIQLDEPCTTAKKALAGPWGGQLADVLNGELTGKALEGALRRVEVSADDVGIFGKALSALGIAAKVWKTVAYYSNAKVRVIASNSSVHKPLEDESKYVLFVARAGVSPDEWEEFQKRFGSGKLGEAVGFAERAVRDCLASYGLPTVTDIGDIAKDAENWSVEWRLTPADSPHVEIKLGGTYPADDENVFDLPGQFQNKLERVSPTSAETELRLSIKPEGKTDHPGQEVRDTVDVCADVQAGAPPSLGTFVNAAKGGLGLVDSMVELGAGWLQTMLTKSNCARLEVTFHAPYHFKIEGGVVLEYRGFNSGYAEYYERGNVRADFSVTGGADSTQSVSGVGTGSISLDTESTWPTEPFTAGADSQNTIATCAQSSSGEMNWQITGKVIAEDEALELEIATQGANMSGCSMLLPEPQPDKIVFLSGNFKLPLENNTYRFVVNELPAEGQATISNFVVYCAQVDTCSVTSTWNFTVTLLPPEKP